MMLKITSYAVSTVIILALVVDGIVRASDVTTLPEVVVKAKTSDNFTVFLPQEFIPSALLEPNHSSIGDIEFETKLTRAQVCEVLKKGPPPLCTISNYPASPGIPSAAGAEWKGNGCGAGPTATFYASAILTLMHPSTYSGDLNKPVKYNPSIDFTDACNMHDSDYTSPVPKAFSDNLLGRHLKSICDSALSDVATCLSFKDTYVFAVKHGANSAYEDDQRQLACSAWGSSMKKSGCSS